MEAAGFELFVPDVQEEPQYVISGHDYQVVTVSLKPEANMTTEGGSYLFGSPFVKSGTTCPDGSCGRAISGEACCLIEYTNRGDQPGYVGLTPNFPAKVVPLPLSTLNNKVVVKAGAYMAHIGDDVKVGCDLDCVPLRCCVFSCIRQSITGTGTAFLAAGGTVITKRLEDGEILHIDETALIGWEDTATLDAKCAGSPLFWCLGGEGCFTASVTGPGVVFMQSMSAEKFLSAIAPPLGKTRTEA